MAPIKPSMALEDVQALLTRHVGLVGHLTALEGGETSQAFTFQAGGQDRVLRLSRFPQFFANDQYACQHFAALDIPIPYVQEIGAVGDLFFAISERVPGHDLRSLPGTDHRRLLPLALDMLDRIHAIDVRASSGYGMWATPGAGSCQQWQQFLLMTAQRETTRDWSAQSDALSIDRPLVARGGTQVQRLVAYCPEERWLIHGDYGYGNVLTDGERITGVIDWAMAGYGDYLYDVAWLGFWSLGGGFPNALERRYAHHPSAAHYAQRIACYQCVIGLMMLGFFAQADREEPYRLVQGRLNSILQALPDKS